MDTDHTPRGGRFMGRIDGKRVTTNCDHEPGGAGKWQSRLGSVCSVSNNVVSAARRRSHFGWFMGSRGDGCRDRATLFAKEREHSFEFGFVRAAAIFADFEGFDVLDSAGGFGTIPGPDLVLEPGRKPFLTVAEILPHFGRAALLSFWVGRHEMGSSVGAAFVELGDQLVEGIELSFDDAINVDDDIGDKGVGFLKGVGKIKKDGIPSQVGNIRAEERHGDHVGSVLDEHAGVTVIRMIIVRAGGDDDVCIPLTDQSDEHAPVFERGEDFAVVNIEHFSFDPEHGGGGLDLGEAPFGERTAGFAPMADVSVGDGDQFDFMTFGGPEGGGSRGLDLAVVGMGTEADDTERSGGFRREDRDGSEPQDRGERGDCQKGGSTG